LADVRNRRTIVRIMRTAEGQVQDWLSLAICKAGRRQVEAWIKATHPELL